MTKNEVIKRKLTFSKKMYMWKIRFTNNFRGQKQIIDFISKIIIYCFAILTILILLILVVFIIYKSIYFFQYYPGGFWNFLSGQYWNANNNQFGIWRIIISTFFVLLIALVFAIPLTIFSSLYISEYLSSNIKRKIIGIIQLLAGIPSVVFGLFSLAILGPLFMLMGAPATSNLLVTSITLAFMGLPVMISLSINALENIPNSYRFCSLALGLSKIHTTYRIVFRSAWFKIITAIMMGVARIIGETMAVMMIAGNAPEGLIIGDGFIKFIFSSISTLSSTIGLEILENSGPMHESALYAIGLMLFIIVCVINIFIISSQAFHNRKRSYRAKKTINNLRLNKSYNSSKINKLFYEHIEKTRRFKKIKDGFAMFFLVSSTVIVVSFTLIILATIIWKGLFCLVWNDLISTSTFNGGAGILSTFLVTWLLVVCVMLFAIPLGLMVSIYLNEYAQSTSKFAKVVRFTINVLSSTPSIIYGTFGLAFFIGVCNLPLSILSSGLTLTIVILPIMIRSIEDALSDVENSLRNASLALGANKTTTIIKVVLPNAMPGIITAVILSIGRVIGESAPIYLTLGTVARLPIAGFMSPGASMTTQILMLSKEGATAGSMRIMFELAFVIMVLIWLSNNLAHILGKKFAPNYSKIAFKQKWKIRINNLKYLFSKNNYFHQKQNFNNFFKKIFSNKKPQCHIDKIIYKKIKKVDPKMIINHTKFDSLDNNLDLIKVKNVDFFYKGNKQALFNISIKIKEHTVTAFIGSSGSGKSTLLRLFNRMNDFESKSVIKGQILIDDKDIYSPKIDIVKLRTDIGMVFQKPSPFPMSIYDNVAYGPRNKGIRDRKLINSIVIESLKRAALWDEVKNNLRDSAFALSGGQQQRLCIARAIAMKSKILLMDEPTSALDPISTSKIEELIIQLKKDFTIVLVTHHMQQAARIADYTAFFSKGKLIEYNKTKIIFSSPNNKKTENYITGSFE